jgi:hypothetical protein
MVVAVVAVRTVKVSVHKVIGVIAMWNNLVAAVRTMFVLGVVRAALVAVGAFGGIAGVHLDLMLVDVALMQRVQMAIVEVIGMPVMKDRSVTTILAVLMRMVFVYLVCL